MNNIHINVRTNNRKVGLEAQKNVMKSFSYNGSDESQKMMVATCLWSTYADLQAAMRAQDMETCMQLIDQLDKLIDNVLKDSDSLSIDKFVKEFEKGIVEPCKSELYISID